MNNKPIFCIVGLSGSGKSTVANLLLEDKKLNLSKLVYRTTRAKRPNEVDGIEYKFTTLENYMNEDTDNIIESRKYNKADEGTVYYYTILKDVSDKNTDAYICTASGHQVLSYITKLENVYIIKLNVPGVERLERLLKRITIDNDLEYNCSEEQCDEICRRFLEEKEEFKVLNGIDKNIILEINNSNSTYRELVFDTIPKIKEFIEQHI